MSTRPAHTPAYDADAALGRLVRARTCGATPFVIGQMGQSLDGRITAPEGMSKYINGAEALRHLHRIRAQVDAVVVGVGTAIADNPLLTTRHVPGRSPVRVVIDPCGRLPGHLTMLHDGAAPVVVVTRPGQAVPCAAVAGVSVIEIAPQGGCLPPAAIARALAARGMPRILVEGGADTLARFLDAGAMDELHIMVAPVVLGGGKSGLEFARLGDPDGTRMRTMRFGDGDLLCLCDTSPGALPLRRLA